MLGWPNDRGMKHTPTPREAAAARCLADALVEFIMAVEDGRAERTAPPRTAPPPTAPPAPAAAVKPLDPGPALLTILEAAEYLGVSPGTVRNMSAPTGPLPSVKIRARRCYSRKDLDAFIARHTIAPLPM